MRRSWGMTLALWVVFSMGASAQQAGSANGQPQTKTKKSQQSAATPVPENSQEPAAKPSEPAAPAPERKPDSPKESPESKKNTTTSPKSLLSSLAPSDHPGGQSAALHRHCRATSGAACRRQNRSCNVFCRLHPGRARPEQASPDLRVQWRPGRSLGVAGYGSAGSETCEARTGRLPAAGALPFLRQPR